MAAHPGAVVVERCELTLSREDQEEKTLVLSAGKTLKVGAKSLCDLRVDLAGVSGVHAELQFVKPDEEAEGEAGAYQVCVRDCSKNGTAVRPGPLALLAAAAAADDDDEAVKGGVAAWERLRKDEPPKPIKDGWQILVPAKSRKLGTQDQQSEAKRAVTIRVRALAPVTLPPPGGYPRPPSHKTWSPHQPRLHDPVPSHLAPAAVASPAVAEASVAAALARAAAPPSVRLESSPAQAAFGMSPPQAGRGGQATAATAARDLLAGLPPELRRAVAAELAGRGGAPKVTSAPVFEDIDQLQKKRKDKAEMRRKKAAARAPDDGGADLAASAVVAALGSGAPVPVGRGSSDLVLSEDEGDAAARGVAAARPKAGTRRREAGGPARPAIRLTKATLQAAGTMDAAPDNRWRGRGTERENTIMRDISVSPISEPGVGKLSPSPRPAKKKKEGKQKKKKNVLKPAGEAMGGGMSTEDEEESRYGGYGSPPRRASRPERRKEARLRSRSPPRKRKKA